MMLNSEKLGLTADEPQEAGKKPGLTGPADSFEGGLRRMTSGSFSSFARQFVVVLKDTRLWIVVLPFLVLVSLIVLFGGPRLAAVLTLPLGLVGSYIIRQIDRLPVIDDFSSLKNLSERILLPA